MSHIDSLARRDGNRCHLCRWMVPREERSIDHIEPRSAGGYSRAANYRLAHKVCNHARSSLPMAIVQKVLAELAAAHPDRPSRAVVVAALYAASKAWQREHTKADQKRARDARASAQRPGRDLARARAVRHQRTREPAL